MIKNGLNGHEVVVSLEVQLLEGEMSFNNASGLHSSSQHILLCGDVIWLGYPLQIIQVADGDTEKNIIKESCSQSPDGLVVQVVLHEVRPRANKGT